MNVQVSAAVMRALTPEARHLFASMVEALADADLEDVAVAVVQATVGLHVDAWRVVMGDTFVPFAELLFRELQFIAMVPGWSAGARRREALMAIALAGFSISA